MSNIWAFLKEHRKTSLSLTALVLLIAGFAVGRFSRTAQIIEKTKTVTQFQDKIVYQDRIVEKKVYVEVQRKREHVETVETKKPDGTTVTQTKADTDVNTGVNQTTNTDSTHAVTETKYVTQIVEKERLVLKTPDWHLYAGVGISVPYYLGQGSVGLPLSGLVVQAGIDRRIAGPFWLGIYGNTQGTLAANLSVSW